MPDSASVIVCSVRKVGPLPVLTVTVEVPPSSAMSALFTEMDSAGNDSIMVTVCAVPTAVPPTAALTTMVSLSSSVESLVAVMVVVMELCPAVSVSDSEPML